MSRLTTFVFLAMWTALGCASDSPRSRAFFGLVDRPAEYTSRPYCVPDGPRVLRAGFRSSTWCTVHYAEGNAIWRRNPWGDLVRGGRMWLLNAEDSLRWPHLRDSITSAVRTAADGIAPCQSEQLVGNGGRATIWTLPGYRLVVWRFERVPGGPPGYRLEVGISPADSSCRS